MSDAISAALSEFAPAELRRVGYAGKTVTDKPKPIAVVVMLSPSLDFIASRAPARRPHLIHAEGVFLI